MKRLILLSIILLCVLSLSACELDNPAETTLPVQPNETMPPEATVPTTMPHVHTFEFSQMTDATCEQQGEIVYLCSCEETYVEYIDAYGHQYTPTETKQPGCTEQGEMTYVCHCGSSYTEPIEAVGHNFGEWFTSIEPTFTTTGEGKRMCRKCDAYETKVLETNTVEQELARMATLASLLPKFQSASDMSASELFDWVRIQAGWVSNDFDDTTYQITIVYSLSQFDAVTQQYFGCTYNFAGLTENDESLTVDASGSHLIWLTYGAGGWDMTALDSFTQIDSTHYSIRYYVYDYEDTIVGYGTMNVRLTSTGFVIESHS